jgi:hypothetical protein
MKFLLYFIVWHDGLNHHGNIVIDTPPSRENIESLREAIAKMSLMNCGTKILDPAKQVTICNVIPLPDRIIARNAPNILTRNDHGH